MHNTKGQSDGSASVGDVSGNPENSATNVNHETVDDEVFNDHGIKAAWDKTRQSLIRID